MEAKDGKHNYRNAKNDDDKGDSCSRIMPSFLAVVVCIHTGQTLHTDFDTTMS